MQPLITRRLKLCFEVTAHFNPIPESALQQIPELAAWQESLLANPDIVSRIMTYQALVNLQDHMRVEEEFDRWTVHDTFELLFSLLNRQPLEFGLGLLQAILSREAESEYLAPFWRCIDTEEKFQLHVFEDDRALEWAPENPAAILEHDREHGFLFADLNGATTLVIYLEKTGAGQVALNGAAVEAEKIRRDFQQVLGLAATDDGQIDPLAESLILENLQIAFPGLPVQVRSTLRRTFKP